jgi:ArsR family transcriptional regulator
MFYTFHIDKYQYEVYIMANKKMTLAQVAEICKALGDNNRLQIVELLTHGELCACKLLEQFNITQPTLSHHMKVLAECNLITTHKDGKWCYYSLNCPVFKEFRTFIGGLCCENTTGCRCK